MFNEDGAIVVNQAILTSRNDSSLEPFNPFTQTPVEGVHWRKGPNFGQATSVKSSP